ncbi:MAG: hypothetical protein JO290_08710 [Sphingomonadaceae bacterium]|nr:hypothetical protein [Sphingomonadaceae bacterium]
MILVAACSSTRQVADIGFTPPAGSYKLIVMRPDVSVGLLTASGIVEPREDWTEKARANVLAALVAQQAGRGGLTTVAATREEAGGDPAVLADLDRLHTAIGKTIELHKYSPLTLPTKASAFDWTLGEPAVAYGRTTGYDYALFFHASDSFASSGRVALQVLGFMGCAVGVCYIPHGGQQGAFASLVDLHTGRIVWFNVRQSSIGDMRTPDGAQVVVAGLLDKMKTGASLHTTKKPAARS